MSNFIADARIVVRADTSAFTAEITRITKAAERQKILVKIVPDPTGFTNAVRQVIRDTQPTLPPIRIRMVADPTGFRASVRAAAVAATEGLTIPVGVTAGQAGAARGGAVAAGGVVDRRLSSAQLAIATATDAGVAARRRFDKTLSDSEKQMLRDQRIAAQLKTSTDAVTAATIAGNPALLAQAEALQLVAIRENELNIARKERAAAPGVRAAADAEAAAAAAAAESKAAADAAAREIAAFNKTARARASLTSQITRESGERIAATQDEIRAILAQQEAEAQARKAQLATSRQARFRQRQVATAAPFAEEAFARNQAIADSADAAARAETQFAAARRASARATVLASDPERALAATRAAERASIDAVVESQIAYNAAVESGIPALITTREQELALAKARLTDSATASANAERLAVAAGRIGAGRRALEAFGATLAGLRGAALSAQGAFIAVGAAAIAVTKAVQSAAAFESTLNVFRVTAGATADEMERVRATASSLGRDITLPGVGAQDAAEALTELSKAGLSVQDSIDGARGVLQLATAAAIDNQQATELAASALNAFGLAGNQAVRVADTLANAANASQGSIVDIGVALQQSAAVARQSGLTLEQTVGVLTLFARAGLKGSDAGTSFRTALIRLINPTSKAQKEIDKLGLHLRTATGAINLGVFDEFTQKTQDLTKAQRDQALAIIFGQDAIRGAAILAREGNVALNAQIVGLKRQGTAAELANARMTGFTGSLENLKNQLSSAGIAIGTVLIPPLQLFTNAVADQVGLVTDLVGQFISLEQHAKDLAKALAELPQDLIPDVKIGPIDTKKQSKGISDAIKKGASIGLKSLAAGGPSIPLALEAKGLADQFFESKTQAKDVAREVRIILSGLKGASDTMADINFVRVVGELEKLQERLAKGDKNAQRLSGDVADIITKLKEGNALPPFRFPKVKLPPELQTGLPGKQAGDAITAAFDAALPGPKIYGITFNAFNNVGKAIEDNAQFVLSTINTVVPQTLAFLRAKILEGTTQLSKDVNRRAGALEEQATELSIAGATPAAKIRNLRRQFANQQRIIDATAGQTGKDAVKDRRAAKEKQDQINEAIRSIEEQRKSDAESAKAKVKQARDDADQAFLDSLVPAENRVERQTTRAAGTAQLQDDRRAMVARRALLRKEISLIQDNLNDTKDARDEIAQRRNEIIQLDNDIAQKTQDIRQSAFEHTQTRLERRQNIAEQFGDIAAQRRIITRRIKEYNKLIHDFKGEKSALDDLKKERDSLIQARKGLAETKLEQQEALAQSIFDLTGNKNPLLKAINAEIAAKKREIAAAKKAGHATVLLQTELNNLLAKRKELLKSANEDKGKGTTAFDLLNEFNAKFTDIAGNIINANQPFAGGSAFSTDIVNKAIDSFTGPPHRKIDMRLRGEDGQSRWIKVTEDLISAIRENTEAQRGGRGNRSTVTEVRDGIAVGPFHSAKQAREVRDG